ncbi:MAG: LysE family translocator [Pseudomonas sp.]|uniref:LysE family translocator n=1 Tax=Pseudomonas abieticivorans TaxID=2931382 RepID=UPI0020BEF488|nr:LysE family translocator [Pseudomonas sp. PIA16]MDE1166467.1 LysE family translocator [Pseudomonas sp.]
MTLTSYLYFIVFCASMTFSPGPMTLLLLGLGLNNGLKSSLPAQLGASLAYLISILIFAVGLSELLQDHAGINRSLQLIGVAYILYLAWHQWSRPAQPLGTGAPAETTFKGLFGKGLLTGFSNPKTLILFSAVFPQFVSSTQHKTLNIALLGATFLVLQLASGCLYGYFGQRIKHLLQEPKRQVMVQRGSAVVLVGVAAMLGCQ